MAGLVAAQYGDGGGAEQPQLSPEHPSPLKLDQDPTGGVMFINAWLPSIGDNISTLKHNENVVLGYTI